MALKDKKEMLHGMSYIELNELVRVIEEEFGVTAAAPLQISSKESEDSSDVPELTLKQVEKKIKQYEIITGMSFEAYRRAYESGEVKNVSSVGLDIWELLEEQKKEITNDGRER